jgi:hypothetical protein
MLNTNFEENNDTLIISVLRIALAGGGIAVILFALIAIYTTFSGAANLFTNSDIMNEILGFLGIKQSQEGPLFVFNSNEGVMSLEINYFASLVIAVFFTGSLISPFATLISTLLRTGSDMVKESLRLKPFNSVKDISNSNASHGSSMRSNSSINRPSIVRERDDLEKAS